MGTSYDQLNMCERKLIDRLLGEGRSIRGIAAILGRSPSSISRERRRNSKPTKAWPGGYDAQRAQTLTQRRRKRGRRHKLARQPDLRRLVYNRLAMGWSPDQIAGRLARQHGRTVISHESIYRYAYHRSAQKVYWHRLLPRAKHKRGRLKRRGANPVDSIKHRVPIHKRSKAANQRRQAGHWEADLMLFSKYGQAILVAHERYSRFIRIRRQPSKAAKTVRKKLMAIFKSMPEPLRRSLTCDNGTEFAQHYMLTENLKMKTYFCDPHAPWQKGGIENAIGRLRRPLPRKADLATLSHQKLTQLAKAYNQTPRRCLGFLTPEEVFNQCKKGAKNVALET